jgi:D-3-phosphoglycerate dehydrogenase
MKPVIVVAEAALSNRSRLVEQFSDDLELRFADVSTASAVAEATAEADGIVVALQPLRRELIEAFGPQVKVIGRAGVGLDSIDLDAAEESGVTVINQPAYGVLEVASHGVAMLLAIHRKLRAADQYVRDGWSGPFSMGELHPIDELTVGLVGCGRIGSAMADMLAGLAGAVIAYDPFAAELPSHVEAIGSLDDLLARSDIVSLHAPLTDETRGLMDKGRFGTMKAGSLLVNVSRGPLVDEAALADALESGQLAGAALDVFATEPLPADSPLLSAPNTLFSPHVAAYSERAAWRLGSWTLGDALTWIRSGEIEHGTVVVRGTR